MSTIEKSLRVLVVDDNRDGADTLGLIVEEFGHQAHVTYGGLPALDVATAFRPDLIFVDLVMPGMNGFDLVKRFRELPAFANTKIVAITAQKNSEYQALAMQAGCDLVFLKPVAMTAVQTVLSNMGPDASATGNWPKVRRATSERRHKATLADARARRIRSERASKNLTQAECEAAICDGIIRFRKEYLGWKSEQVHVHIRNDILVVPIHGVLTLAERQLGKSSPPDKGRDLIKQARKQLLELARPMLESLVHEAAGVKVLSLHHDLSTVTGEEVVVFSLAEAPRFGSEHLGRASNRPAGVMVHDMAGTFLMTMAGFDRQGGRGVHLGCAGISGQDHRLTASQSM